MTVSFDGLGDLPTAVLDLGDKLDDFKDEAEEAVQKAGTRLAESLVQQAKIEAPVGDDEDSGNLRESITKVKHDDTSWTVEARADYAYITEMGGVQTIEGPLMVFEKGPESQTGYPGELVFTHSIEHTIPAQPFMRPAVDKVEEQVEPTIKHELQKAFDDAF